MKLWSSILDSSIWSQPPNQRIVWVTMLAMADANGFVGASVDGLARRANVPIEDVEAALESFMAPDPRSRSEVEDGRRIRKVDRGWHIINYGHFRKLRDKEARQTYERERKREQRARAKLSGTASGQSGTNPHLSPMSAQAEAYADGDGEAEIQKESTSEPVAALPESSLEREQQAQAKQALYDWQRDGFEGFWDNFDYKVDRKAAWKAWLKVLKTNRLTPGDPRSEDFLFAMFAKVREYVRATPDRQFRKHPATWLNGSCWENEVVPQAKPAQKANLRPVEHMRNMPLGTPSCMCPECRVTRGEMRA